MKIAVCFSGHMRKFRETYPIIRDNLLNRYDCDIFIHTWDKLGFACQYKVDATLDDINPHLNEINNLFKPKKIIVESTDFVNELINQGNNYAPHLITCPKPVGHMASMFYKIFACNELRKNYQLETGTEYDWVVRCRPDLLFYNQISMPTEHYNKKIWLPKGHTNPEWFTDQFAIAAPHDMDLYSSVYFDIPEYFSQRLEYYPEKFMVWAFKKKDLIYDVCDVYYHIHR